MSQLQATEQEKLMKDAAAIIHTLDMTYLQELQSVIIDAMKKKKGQAIRESVSEVQKIAARIGMSVEELLKISKSAKSGPVLNPAPQKYRHPDNPSLQWTGRGHTPQWIKDWSAANGGDLSGAEIKAA